MAAGRFVVTKRTSMGLATLMGIMTQLANTKIYRGGVSQRKRSLATNRCSMHPHHAGLRLEFSIASKGGGDTGLLLDIGQGDFAAILEAVAEAFPENSAALFGRCAARASEKLLGRLTQTEERLEAAKTQAGELCKQLEPVEAFVREKYQEAAAGHDEREGAVQDRLIEVANALLYASM